MTKEKLDCCIFATPYNNSNLKPEVKCTQKTKTQQHMKAECDITNIIRKYNATGLLPAVREAQASYGDFSNCHDYQSSLNEIIEANNAFDAMPAQIRKKFNHNPANFLEFVSNPENIEEMIKMGLAEPKPLAGAEPPRSSGEPPEAPKAA